ncbi:MAG: DUF2029 domain-containing protein [Ardenticatenaceae bacterium]|nr:DUF2029 domain-containing protein [Ardenticatenaceae bacterium]MCB9443053.1 DUF2029 domain-containing protein [Ardenticatenaceae bacterium]
MRSYRPIIIAFIIVAALALLVWLTAIIPSTAPASYGDFQAYWSASYLLAHSQNFTDLDLLLQIEQTHTGWTQDFVMSTWNPPWLLVLLIPYTWLSFRQAAWLWLLTNISLVFTASVLSWRVNCWINLEAKRDWIPLLMAFLYVPTLVAIFVGQVNTLIYFGLAGFLYFYLANKPFTAGAMLALTLVKPHLVYVTLPIVMLIAARERRWRVWWGLGSLVVLLTGIAFGLRPTFVLDYGRSMATSSILSWQTPTLGGILTLLLGWDWSKWIGVVILPLTIGLWFWWPDKGTLLTWLNGTLLISLFTAPFGWGYDAIVLLLPILQMAAWAVTGHLKQLNAILLFLSLLIVNLVLLRLRLQGINEVYYFGLPVVIAGLYMWAQSRLKVPERQLQLST